jgi:hypothetical protein
VSLATVASVAPAYCHDAGAPPAPAQAASPADSAKQSSVPINVVFDMLPILLPK